MRTARILAASSLALTLGLMLASPAMAGDVILMQSGRKQGNPKSGIPPSAEDYAESNITIVEEKLDETTFRIDGIPTPQSSKASEIAETFHDPSNIPQGLVRGKRLIDSGQFPEAVEALGSVAGDRRAQPWSKAEAAYRLIEAHLRMGALDEASGAVDAFLAEFSTSKYLIDATRASASIKEARGDAKGARAAYESLRKLPGIPDAEKFRVDYGIASIDARLAMAAGNQKGIEAALKKFRELALSLKGRSGMEDLRGECLVWEANCVVAMGRYAEAQELATKLIDGTDDPLVRAGAYTMLGRAIVLQNAGSNDKAKYKEALLHFLKVVTLYGGEPGAEDYMAESLYRAGELFYELRPAQAKTDEEKDASRKAVQRARREWRECVQRFPRSQWAQKSRTKLGS